METKLSSISQLEQADKLSANDLFVISQPNKYQLNGDYTQTGYVSKKLSFGTFSDYLSTVVIQDLVNKISNISGNVYTTTSVLNYVTGTLIQNINTAISNVSGNVDITIGAVNYISGDVYNNLSTNISKISGDVSAVNTIENNVSAMSANIENNIQVGIDRVSGDVYSEGGIANSISAMAAYIENKIDVAIEEIVGDIYSDFGIANVVSALCADIRNKIDIVINDISGDVRISGGIFNWVSAQNAQICSIVNDIDAIRAAVHYPIVELNNISEDDNKTDYLVKDKTVNIIHIDDEKDVHLTFETIEQEHDPTTYYSRDFEIVMHCGASPRIYWDKTVQYKSPIDEELFSTTDVGQIYIYYVSEIGQNIMYINRQELNDIIPPYS